MIPEAAVEAAQMAGLGRFHSKATIMSMLEAAAPHMLAEAKADAWQEGVEAESDRGRWGDYATNPYRTAK